ncbi:hypothetical protein EV294_10984 [Paenibacillus sp. BK033]|nr:hypothetical protein EV294_10984 [Paenibacillus sp. BK033]
MSARKRKPVSALRPDGLLRMLCFLWLQQPMVHIGEELAPRAFMMLPAGNEIESYAILRNSGCYERLMGKSSMLISDFIKVGIVCFQFSNA